MPKDPSPSSETPQSLGKRVRLRSWVRYALKGLLLTSLAGALVIGFSVDSADWRRLEEFPPWLAAVILGMVVLAWICNGLRTMILARALGHPLSLSRSVGITLSMEFAIAASPGGVGGWITRGYLQGRAGIPLPKTVSMMAADASADALFFILLFPFALGAMLELEPVRELLAEVNWANMGAGAVAVLGGLALFGWLWARGYLATGLRRLPAAWRARVSPRGRLRKVAENLRRQARGVRTSAGFLLRERRGHYLAAFGVASLQWSCRYSVLPVVLWGLGSPVDPLALVFVQGCLFLLGLVVVAPGGGGSLEILTALILEPLVGAAQAALAVVLWRLFTYYLYLLGGAGAFFIMFTGNRADGDSPIDVDALATDPDPDPKASPAPVAKPGAVSLADA